jgi:hypothetical protein
VAPAAALISVLGCSDCDPDASDIRRQITQALDRHVEQGVLLERSPPCGSNGIESGRGAFSPELPASDREHLIDDYAQACERLRACS